MKRPPGLAAKTVAVTFVTVAIILTIVFIVLIVDARDRMRDAETAKLGNLRARPQTTLTFRAGWEWAVAEGPAELIGPDDPHAAIDTDGLRRLLREVFVSAGGTHDDWDAYDRTMVEQRRAVVLIAPTRVYSNGPP